MMSRRLLESLAKNSRLSSNEGFDFTKSAASIASQSDVAHSDIDLELPLTPQVSSWEMKSDQSGNYLEKTYVFHSKDHLKYFLEEAVDESERIDHHPVMIIKKEQIKVILTTDTLQDVSELDVGFSKFLDEIFEDIHFIGSSF